MFVFASDNNKPVHRHCSLWWEERAGSGSWPLSGAESGAGSGHTVTTTERLTLTHCCLPPANPLPAVKGRYRHLSLYNGTSWSLKLGAKHGSDRHRAEVRGLRPGGAQADWRGWLHQYANHSDWEVMEPCQKPETHVNNCKTIKSSCWVSLRTHHFHFLVGKLFCKCNRGMELHKKFKLRFTV